MPGMFPSPRLPSSTTHDYLLPQFCGSTQKIMFSLRAEGFFCGFCGLGVLYGSLGISKIAVFDIKKEKEKCQL
jgi:hypothetical protein